MSKKHKAYEPFLRNYRDGDGEARTSPRFSFRFSDHTGKMRLLSAFKEKDRSVKLAGLVKQLVLAVGNEEPPSPEATKYLRIVPERIRNSLMKWGIIDAKRNANAAMLTDHVEAFRLDLGATAGKSGRDRTARFIDMTVKRVESILNGAKAVRWSDVTKEAIEAHLASLRSGENPCAPMTRTHYTRAIKQFCRWMVHSGRAAYSPLEGLQAGVGTRERERRALSLEEWRWLYETSFNAPDRFGMTGQERALLYAMAIQTGLRANELRSITLSRLFLDGNAPYVLVDARTTKNRKAARQYIKADLAEAIKRLCAMKHRQGPVFGMPAEWDTAKMLRADLADARIVWLEDAKHDHAERERREQSDFLMAENHDHKHVDFHSLRYTCGAWLAMAGVPVKTVQTVMRHSTITLTMDTYGSIFPGQEADAVARFPDMMRQDERATGTLGRIAPEIVH